MQQRNRYAGVFHKCLKGENETKTVSDSYSDVLHILYKHVIYINILKYTLNKVPFIGLNIHI